MCLFVVCLLPFGDMSCRVGVGCLLLLMLPRVVWRLVLCNVRRCCSLLLVVVVLCYVPFVGY